MTATGRATARRVSGDVPAAVYPYPASAEIVDGRFAFRGLPPGEYDISFEGRAGERRVKVEASEVVELSF
jgi:hypothetical protein